VIIKVCGILDTANHQALSTPGVDMIGINFYAPSKRYIGDATLPMIDNQQRVGVFVKASIEEIKSAVTRHHLDFAQLHGDESVELCKEVQEIVPIIKVFRITDDFDWSQTSEFSFADYFLFDTFTKVYGGSGKRFDWNQLDQYTGTTPFLLSGGIRPEDVEAIKQINHPLYRGVDINSGFEIEPGIKNAEEVTSFVGALKS